MARQASSRARRSQPGAGEVIQLAGGATASMPQRRKSASARGKCQPHVATSTHPHLTTIRQPYPQISAEMVRLFSSLPSMVPGPIMLAGIEPEEVA